MLTHIQEFSDCSLACMRTTGAKLYYLLLFMTMIMEYWSPRASYRTFGGKDLLQSYDKTTQSLGGSIPKISRDFMTESEINLIKNLYFIYTSMA